MSTYAYLEGEIVRWAEQRKIIPNSTPQAQLLKTMEELGELTRATIKDQQEEIVDGVGDVMVTLIIYCALKDINLVHCMEVAYDAIKHRKGTLNSNGLFVKEA
jgi:NTP pyrophosphatase (non-canonical NTP hydrolase)